MDIIKDTKSLNFPLGKYVVVGSGHLVALGLKEGNDIDILVSEEIFDRCKNSGDWEVLPWTYPDKIGHIYLRKGFFELYMDVNKGNFTASTNELIDRSVLIEGVPFISLEDLLALKREYLKVNPKHKKDIETIEKLLEKNN